MPFYESLLYIVFSYMLGEDMPELLDLYIKPGVGCCVMLIQGAVFFALSVYIDYRKTNSFQKNDLKVATQFPYYLIPDNDVLTEESHIRADSERY